jgi:hypothetical protein
LNIAVAYYMTSASHKNESQEIRTSLLLFELSANAWRKFTCGSLIWVFPERTTQPRLSIVLQTFIVIRDDVPVTTMTKRMIVLKRVKA